MFERGPIRGTNAAQEKCAAKEEFRGNAGSAWVAQLVERVLGKDEVTGSIPVPGSRNGGLRSGRSRMWGGAEFAPAGKGVGTIPGGGNSTVESHSSKVMVAGSNPVPRARFRSAAPPSAR